MSHKYETGNSLCPFKVGDIVSIKSWEEVDTFDPRHYDVYHSEWIQYHGKGKIIQIAHAEPVLLLEVIDGTRTSSIGNLRRWFKYSYIDGIDGRSDMVQYDTEEWPE